MRFRGIILTGAGLAIGVAGSACANGPVMRKGVVAQPTMRSGTTVHRWGPRYNGRWYAGWYAPGGWAGYRRPVVGAILPRYWISPSYYIRDYGAYGLPVPVNGYGWSRYYDDAVLTDREGRVRDYRSDVSWNDQDAPPPPGLRYDDEVTAPDGPPPTPHGRRPGVDFDPPPSVAAPRVTHRPGEPLVTTTQAPGTISGGYYYPGAVTTTVVVQPAVTTTTTRTYVTQGPARKRRK